MTTFRQENWDPEEQGSKNHFVCSNIIYFELCAMQNYFLLNDTLRMQSAKSWMWKILGDKWSGSSISKKAQKNNERKEAGDI